MPTVTMVALVPPGMSDPDTVFSRISDFAKYADYTDAVRSVTVTGGDGIATDSDWSVNFRSGVLCWSERDWIDPVARTIVFSQLAGDFESFEGGWSVDLTPVGVAIRFTATFDLGMPSLASLVNPVAERALKDNMGSILTGLLGPGAIVTAATEQQAVAAVGSPT